MIHFRWKLRAIDGYALFATGYGNTISNHARDWRSHTTDTTMS
jgi:hypothetical protein